MSEIFSIEKNKIQSINQSNASFSVTAAFVMMKIRFSSTAIIILSGGSRNFKTGGGAPGTPVLDPPLILSVDRPLKSCPNTSVAISNNYATEISNCS